MSIIPLYFINLDMVQASTAGTAILGAERNEGGGGNISINRLSQIRLEKTPLFQISSPPSSCSTPNKSSTANCAREMIVRIELIKIR